jgi:hypothetical protein
MFLIYKKIKIIIDSMKYMKTYESFRNSKDAFSEEEPVNEIFGAIGRFFSNMFKKAGELIRKTKGGNEVDAIYNKYLTKLSDEFQKSAGVSLNLMAVEKQAELDGKSKPAEKPVEKPEAQKEGEATQEGEVKKESLRFNGNLIKEAEEVQAQSADVKMTPETLKQKKAILDQIVKKIKDMAIKEMDAVLKKLGGPAENPQLEAIISAKKDQFDLDFLNAQIKFLEESGDKTMVPNLVKQRDLISKKIEKTYKDMATLKAVKYESGDDVIYLLKGKTKDDWNKLTDDEKKKPTEGKAKEIVGIHTLDKIEGDKFTLLDKDGKPTIIKTGAEIVGKSEAPEGAEKVDFKEGDTVKYKKKDGTENQAEVLKIDGDDVQLKTEKVPSGFAIKSSQILSVVTKEEGKEGEGQEQKEGQGQAQKEVQEQGK